jgi:hypothetical protein
MEVQNQQPLYSTKDNLCAKAIVSFKVTSSVPEWLRENHSLFDAVTYQPIGLPGIVSSNLGDLEFGNIRNVRLAV